MEHILAQITDITGIALDSRVCGTEVHEVGSVLAYSVSYLLRWACGPITVLPDPLSPKNSSNNITNMFVNE